MRILVIRAVWKILCWWQKVAEKHGFGEQVDEVKNMKRKIVDCKMKLLEKEKE